MKHDYIVLPSSKEDMSPSSPRPSSSHLWASSFNGAATLIKPAAARDSAWADGLRGIAALFVMSSHIVLTLDRRLINPCCGPDEATPLLFQRPILRLVSSGQSWVSMFILLSGFVNSLKPISLARSGDTSSALQSIARSSFGRSFRLFLPAAAATLLSWTFEQLGLYSYARKGEGYWTRQTSPPQIESFRARIIDLFTAIWKTWSFNGENPYDQPQWAMKHLLQGSMFVFIMLVMTVRLQPRWRVAIMGLLYWVSQDWSLKFPDPLVGANVFAGAILAELSIVLSSFNNSAIFRTVTTMSTVPLFLLALVLMSMPMDNYGAAAWSSRLMHLLQPILPTYHEPPRQVVSVGCQLLGLSLVLSPLIRAVFAFPSLLWLGKVSFAIYLLHGPLLRSVFAWCLFLGSTPKEISEEVLADPAVLLYPLPGNLRIGMSIVVFLVVLAGVAHLWALKVEPVFAKMTKKAEDVMFMDEAEMTFSRNSPRNASMALKLKTDVV